MDYLALFSTTTGAVKFRRKLERMNISVEALPVPRELSSSCGIAIQFTWDESLDSLLEEGIEKVYILENNEYILFNK